QAGAITFKKHVIMGERSEETTYGVCFSQPHALALADLDGDGLKDIVVGKRMWAHPPPKDVEPDAAPVLYWFQLVRDGAGGAKFVPHFIDDKSGVGVQVTVADVNGDGKPDILTVSKLGTFLFLNDSRNHADFVENVLDDKSGKSGARGPLRVHPDNPRYFTDGSGKAVYLT